MANDPGDTDTGPNNLQNKPVLSSTRKGATGTTTVRGTLNSAPGKTFNVQFFSNPEGGGQEPPRLQVDYGRRNGQRLVRLLDD